MMKPLGRAQSLAIDTITLKQLADEQCMWQASPEDSNNLNALVSA